MVSYSHSWKTLPGQFASMQIPAQRKATGKRTTPIQQYLQFVHFAGHGFGQQPDRALKWKYTLCKIYPYEIEQVICKYNQFPHKYQITHKAGDEAFSHFWILALEFITIAELFSNQLLHRSYPFPFLNELKHTSGIPSSFTHFSISPKSKLQEMWLEI